MLAIRGNDLRGAVIDRVDADEMQVDIRGAKIAAMLKSSSEKSFCMIRETRITMGTSSGVVKPSFSTAVGSSSDGTMFSVTFAVAVWPLPSAI